MKSVRVRVSMLVTNLHAFASLPSTIFFFFGCTRWQKGTGALVCNFSCGFVYWVHAKNYKYVNQFNIIFNI